MQRSFASAVVLLLAASSPAQGQTVYGNDSAGQITWELTMPPGGPCLAPNPFVLPCPNAASVCPGVPPPAPMPMPFGDIADDPIADTIYVTDGRVVVAHAGDVPCGIVTLPCRPLDAFFVPATLPAMGMLTGMGCDGSGTFTGGAPLLWITDGQFVAGIVPPPLGSCGAAAVLFPPCPLPPNLVPATDVSWDPVTGWLWVVSAAGFVQPLLVPGCGPAAPPTAIVACGLAPPFTGLAYDTSTPNFTGDPPTAYVTDGATIARVDLTTGAAAAPSFAAPNPCSPAPAPFSGLAFAHHGINYGTNRISSRLGSFGQSTSPGPSFGIELLATPPFVPAYLIVNTNFPGPGFLCPPLFGVGTNFWVDPTLSIIPLGLTPGAAVCALYPIPIGPGLPQGLEIFLQVVLLPVGSPVAIDATEGLTVTIGLP